MNFVMELRGCSIVANCIRCLQYIINIEHSTLHPNLIQVTLPVPREKKIHRYTKVEQGAVVPIGCSYLVFDLVCSRLQASRVMTGITTILVNELQ